jgi:hypothetical protein
MLRQRHQKVTLHEDRRRSQIESKLSKELVETKAALKSFKTTCIDTERQNLKLLSMNTIGGQQTSTRLGTLWTIRRLSV